MLYKLNSFVILCLVSIASANADDYDSVKKLKTFFTSATERAQLDEIRQAGKFDGKAPGSTLAISIEPKKVKVRGVVMRENAAPVVWVNDGSTLKSRTIDSDIQVNTHRIKSPDKIPVYVDEKRLIMKPGQEWTESGNTIKDRYQTK